MNNKLTELSKTTHSGLKLDTKIALRSGAMMQTLNLKVTEVGHAASNFPVFFMPNSATGGWALTALTSFKPETNLFVNDGRWDATYLPISVQTYPFFLIHSEREENTYTIGIDEQNDAFSSERGELLFDDSGNASPHLTHVTKLLNSDLQNTVHTAQFVEALTALELLKAIDLVVHYQDTTSQNMTGLHTIDEDKLSLLSPEQLAELNKQGFLIPLHAMLISLYQVNLLIQKNNRGENADKISQVKIELTRDKSAE